MARNTSFFCEVVLNHPVQVADGNHLHLEAWKVVFFRASKQLSVFKSAKAFNPCAMALAIEEIRTQLAHIALLRDVVIGRAIRLRPEEGFFNFRRAHA